MGRDSEERKENEKNHLNRLQGHRHGQQRPHRKGVTRKNHERHLRRSRHRTALQIRNQGNHEGTRLRKQRLPLQVLLPLSREDFSMLTEQVIRLINKTEQI